MVVVPYVELTPRGKADYHEDLVVTEGGSAFDFTGYTNFICQLKAKDDVDGANVMVAIVAIANPPGTDGLLDLDIPKSGGTGTTDAQIAEIFEGNTDMVADNAGGDTETFFQGTWRLDLGVSD